MTKDSAAAGEPQIKLSNQATRDAIGWLSETGDWRVLVHEPRIQIGVGLQTLEAYGYVEKRRTGHLWEFRSTPSGMMLKEQLDAPPSIGSAKQNPQPSGPVLGQP